MRPPAQCAQLAEARPVLPPGDEERVSGYGVMGLPFASGHILGLRRWTASSVGNGFTSIWHRDPGGKWTFYESVDGDSGCTRYFGADVERVEIGPIDLRWQAPHRLHVRTGDAAVDWTIEAGSTSVTRLMSMLGVAMPMAAWRSPAVLSVMGAVAGRMLRVGKLRLTGETSNGQHFLANPRQIWLVTDSQANVRSVDLGRPGPLPEQAHLADFYFPQRGILAVGRVSVRGVAEGVRGPGTWSTESTALPSPAKRQCDPTARHLRVRSAIVSL